MHPAYSVILFTTLSGAGFGLLFWVCMLLALALPGFDQMLLAGCLLLGLVLASAGLLASLAHLGNPQRAWRAFSQWRSSWLSREGVLAVTSLALCAGLLGIVLLIAGNPGWSRALAALAAVVCALTVYATARIYSSLRTVPAWHLSVVALLYLACAAVSGLALFAVAYPWWESDIRIARVLAMACALSMAGLALLFRHYWARVATVSLPTLEHATGLDALGPLRVFEAPHTESSYLLDEMGYRVARKHATRLRRVCLFFGLLPAAALWLLAAALSSDAMRLIGPPAMVFLALALGVQRWLFFAQARHVVSAYYGKGDRAQGGCA